MVYSTNMDTGKIQTLWRKPSGAGPFPTVIFVHGLGMTMHEYKNSFDEIADLLVKNNFATLQFQFPIFVEDKCRELPLFKRAAILEEVLKQVKQPYGILAQSYGAATLLASGNLPAKSYCFVSGAYNFKQSIERVYQERGVKINYQGETTLPRISGENTTIGADFWQDAEKFSAIEAVKKIHAPILFLHGDQDTKIPSSVAQKIYAAAPSPQKQLKIFAGGDHGIVDVPRPLREEFLQEIIRWYTKTL